MFFAVFMGIYYSEWQFKKKMYLIESRLAQKGYIPVPKKNYKADACLSFLIPVTVHAFYNHCCSSLENSIMPLVFIALMVFLYVKGFKTIKKQSKYDEYNLNAINKVIFNKYPQLLEHELEEDLFEVNT